MLTHTRHAKYNGRSLDVNQEFGYFQPANSLYDPYATLVPQGTPWWMWCDEDGSNVQTVDASWGSDWMEENDRRYRVSDTLAREYDQREEYLANGGTLPEREVSIAASMRMFDQQLDAAMSTIDREVQQELASEAAIAKGSRDPIKRTLDFAQRHPIISGLVASFLYNKAKG